MPNRIIREGILTSNRIAQLTPLAELFYRRLMSVVDDFGRYTANPTLLRAFCYPLKLDSVKEDSIMKHLAECVGAELIVLYTVEGKEYLEMRDFKQQVRAKDSKYPADDLQMHSTCIADATQMRSTCKQMLPKAETESKTKEELKSSPKENEEKESSSPRTTGGRLPPLSEYYSPEKKQPVAPTAPVQALRQDSGQAESSMSSLKTESKTGRNPEELSPKARPTFRGTESNSSKVGKLEMVWIAAGKSKADYDRLTKPPLPELSEDDLETLGTARVEVDKKTSWYYRRGKALIGEGRFSELCHTCKNLRQEGKAAKVNDTARFMSYLAKEVGK